MSGLMNDIARIPKSYFSLTDIAKVSTLARESLWVSLSRLVKQGRLVKLARGWYTADIAAVNLEQFAPDLYPGSYLSFESVLAAQGILSQQPMAITCATRRQRKTVTVGGRDIIYRHLQPKMFWGYRRVGQVSEAEPEKALLDLAYLSLRGYAKFDAEEMHLDLLDKKKLSVFLRSIGSPELKRLIDEAMKKSL